MSCYQVLALDNNKGDLSITQGNKVNLVAVIQAFSVKTPVVDFKIDGSILQLYYRDAAGILQLKTVTLPATGNNNTAISVASTSSITASIVNGLITSNVAISATVGNAVSLKPDGLFVTQGNVNLGVTSTASIALTLSGINLSAGLIVSPAAGNALIIQNDGAYVSSTTLTNAQIRNLFTATAPLQFDNTTGIISETQATTSTPGFVTSSDWNLFFNKISNGQSVGSVSSTPVYKQNLAGVLQFRPIATGAGLAINLLGDDIVLSTTSTVPVVSAGVPISITLPTSSITMSGSASVSNGVIVSTFWDLIAGPNEPTITDASGLATTVTGLVAGTYRFRLTAIASTGLVGVSSVSATVNSGSITLDTIYIGAQSSATPPNAAAVAAGISSLQNGALDVSADWTSLTAGAPLYCWFAIPNLGGSYFKTKWFVDSLNHGNIGTGTDLFGAYTQATIGGIVYNIGFSSYQTQFTGVALLQA